MKTIDQMKAIARGVNMKEVRSDIDEGWLETKIINHLERNPHVEMSLDEIKERIMNDDLTASFFAKDPSRQNFTEKVISQVIKATKGVSKFEDLPSSTCWYLINGEVKFLTERPVGIKNIDYTFNHGGRRFVATQKYTKDNGGAQDNQFNDVITFLNHSIGLTDITAVAIVDGPYYTEWRLAQLKAINPDAIVVSGFDLEALLND